jgi:hypothetical protein
MVGYFCRVYTRSKSSHEITFPANKTRPVRLSVPVKKWRPGAFYGEAGGDEIPSGRLVIKGDGRGLVVTFRFNFYPAGGRGPDCSLALNVT